MNGEGKVGMDDIGMRTGLGSEKLKPARLVEHSRGGALVVSHSKGTRSRYERRSHSKKVSILLVSMAAIIIVSAVAIAAFGRETQTRAGTQASPPVASFTATAAPGGKLTVDASGSTSSVGIANYSWNFGDTPMNIIAYGVTHVHYYEAGATYTVILTVTDTLGQKNSVSQQIAVANANIPPLPCVLFGDTYASNGVTPLGGCAIYVTDYRTGETLIGYSSDSTGYIYIDDIMPLYVVDGDTLIIQAVGPSGQTGSTSVVADLSTPYIGPVEVTLTVAIPEFTDIAIPIVGMISVFALARVASNRSEEE